MIIASMFTQIQRLLRLFACLFECLWKQLILKEFIGQTLIDQDAVWKRGTSISHQRASIVLQPLFFVATQVPRERIRSPGALGWRTDRGEC